MTTRYTIEYDEATDTWNLLLDGQVIDNFEAGGDAQDLADEYNLARP